MGRDENVANAIVTKKRTFEAAAAYKNQHVAVHNFDADNQIFVHAGVDEEAGEYWMWGT